MTGCSHTFGPLMFGYSSFMLFLRTPSCSELKRASFVKSKYTLRIEIGFLSKEKTLWYTHLCERFLPAEGLAQKEKLQKFCNKGDSSQKIGILIFLPSHDAEHYFSGVSIGNKLLLCKRNLSSFLRRHTLRREVGFSSKRDNFLSNQTSNTHIFTSEKYLGQSD